eukprot:4728599-Pleurochrysis_carterae.AAC.1
MLGDLNLRPAQSRGFLPHGAFRREKKRKVSPAADDEAGESENRRPLGGELSLSLLALLLAERVGLPAQLLSSDEG